jgi:hypothetical protein
MTLQLDYHGTSSFYLKSGSLSDLAGYLEERGFWREPPRSPHEWGRLRSGRGALIVCYRSGTILVQGQYQAQTRGQLGALEVQQ